MATIKFIKARQIFDSRGNPTLEVDVGVEVPEHEGSPILARAAVPSGASSGIYEALELRDGGKDYLAKGVSKAVENVNKIIGPALLGKDPTEQTKIDNYMVQELDGTVNEWGWCKQKLGANAIWAVSLAVCKAGAMVKKIPLYQHIANLAGNKTLVLPVPAFNVINGGSHAGNKLAMQEFMILPVGASSFNEAMKMGVEVYHLLKAVIKKKYGQDATNVGDEGGFAPNIQENKEGLELLKTAIAKAGYTRKVVSGMDVAASEFYDSKDKTYDLNFKEENNDGSQKISGDSLKNVYKSFVSEIGLHVQIVGDDPLRVEKAIWEKACNALPLKVNQIGSVTESIEEERVAIPVISLYALTGISTPQTMRVVGTVLGQRLHVLIDSGSTHNFVSVNFAKKIGCDKVAAPAFEVMVANGALLQCDEIYKSVPMEIQDYEFHTSLYPLELQGFDVILGVEWLQSLGKVIHDWKNLTMEFTMDGMEHVIHGDPILHGAVHSIQKLMAIGLTMFMMQMVKVRFVAP